MRETTFRIGGGLTIALGLVLAYALATSGAGVAYFNAWIAAVVAVGFGAFFLYVAHDETRTRREYLRSLEGSDPTVPRPPRP